MQYQYYSAENSRIFNTHNERLLMYSKKNKLESNFKPLRDYFRLFQESTGFSKSKLIELCTQKADHCFRCTSTQWELPTKEVYSVLCSLQNINGFCRKEYEDLRKEYEDQRRFFCNPKKLEEVLTFNQEAHKTKKYKHPTKKAPTITRHLVETCSRKGQNALIPFAGSGTEIIVCLNHGLNVFASEIDSVYYELIKKRIKEDTIQTNFI
jgi:DNA modification methylase